MAKGAYIGVDNVARKIKKGYIGVDNLARKIKKGYIGIGGVARPFWAGGELVYYGTIERDSSRTYQAAATVGDYALFVCGLYAADTTASATAYSSSLTVVSADPYGSYCYLLAGTSIGDHAIFGGGRLESGSNLAHLKSYDSSLTKTLLSSTLKQARYGLAATTVGDYALFGGGVHLIYSSTEDDNVNSAAIALDAVNSSLTTTSIKNLSYGGDMAATTVGDYALFGGGSSYNSNGLLEGERSSVDAINSSLTRTLKACSLSEARSHLAATTVGNYALFAGGYIASATGTASYSRTVDAFNESLTRVSTLSLGGEKRDHLAATTLGDYALFGGGCAYASRDTSNVSVFDKSLTRTDYSLSVKSYYASAETIGDYALFVGGATTYTNSINTSYYEVDTEVFTIA